MDCKATQEHRERGGGPGRMRWQGPQECMTDKMQSQIHVMWSILDFSWSFSRQSREEGSVTLTLVCEHCRSLPLCDCARYNARGGGRCSGWWCARCGGPYEWREDHRGRTLQLGPIVQDTRVVRAEPIPSDCGRFITLVPGEGHMLAFRLLVVVVGTTGRVPEPKSQDRSQYCRFRCGQRVWIGEVELGRGKHRSARGTANTATPGTYKVVGTEVDFGEGGTPGGMERGGVRVCGWCFLGGPKY